jgi:hypothetical protein
MEEVHLEDVGVDGRILKLMLKKHDLRMWTGLNWLKIGPIEPLSPIKMGNV